MLCKSVIYTYSCTQVERDVANNIATRFRLQSTTSHYDFSLDGNYLCSDDFKTRVGVSTSKISLVHILWEKMAAMKININLQKMAIPNRQVN